MERKEIRCECNGITLVGDRFDVGSEKELLVLHGAGGSRRRRFDDMRMRLAEKGVNTVAFDYIGHGETGGELDGSSLRSRTEQAKAFIACAKMREPIAILGSSMSGYTAVKLTKEFHVRTLILSVPAAYDEDAYDVPFGSDFSGAIRKDKSWDRTDAWEIMKEFDGHVFIVRAEHDEVIPVELTDKLYASAEQAASREMMTVEGATHRVRQALEASPGRYDELIGKVTALL